MVKEVSIPKVYLIFIFLVVSILPTVTAEYIGEFQFEVDDPEIFVTCNNCTSVNFTRVMGPNNQTILSNLESSVDGTYYYYVVDKGNFTEEGTYRYCYEAGNSNTKETGCNTFDITYTGKDLDIGEALVYIILLVFLSFLFILLLRAITHIPTEVRDSENGMIVEFSSLAYLRPVFYGLCWILLMAMLFMAGNLGIAYLDSKMFGIILFNSWYVMMGLTLIAVPLWFLWIIQTWAKSKEMQKLLERGVQF